MQFTPKTEKQIAEEGLYPEGVYYFEIIEALNKKSQKGNEMIELKLKAFDNDGNYRVVNDYLLESMAFKLRHCAYVCGLGEKYESGHLDAFDFVGRAGSLKLGIQKDKKGEYPDKNVVKDYVVPKEAHEVDVPPQAPSEADEIPW